MSADDLHYDFLHYLTCDLPLGYPLKKPVASLLLPTQKSSSRRELLHRQAQFLDFAKQFRESHPWILYLATVKHEAVFFTIPTHIENLVDVVDLRFYRELQATWKELRDSARAGINEATATNCERLVRLQTEGAQIQDAIKKISGAVQAGFTALEPLPPAPPEPEPVRGVVGKIIAAMVLSVIIGALIPSHDGGMAWGILGWIVTGIVSRKVIRKERARMRVLEADFSAYLRHESFRTVCRKSLDLILTLPLETRASGLRHLPECLEALEALPPERVGLEATYIRPFLAK